jgi:hypothetical protein
LTSINRSMNSLLLLEAAVVLCQEPLEMIEWYPVEDGPLRMTGTIDSRHVGKDEARIGPGSGSRLKVQNRQELDSASGERQRPDEAESAALCSGLTRRSRAGARSTSADAAYFSVLNKIIY